MPLSLLAAFGAGILSFLAPCVVPLMPSYLTYLAGTSLEGAQGVADLRWRVSRHALWFVVGCVLFLTLLGALAALLGSAVYAYQQAMEHIAGLLLIIFGIVLTGLVPLPWLSRDYHLQVKPGPSAWWRSGVLGLTFGASWSVCSSPILGSIFVLTAARAQTLVSAVVIMLAFALGQGVPLLLVGLLIDHAGPFLRRIRPYTVRLSQVGGAILILLGFFLLTGLFSNAG